LGNALKFRCGLEPGDQPPAEQPGGCPVDAVLTADPFGPIDFGVGAAVGESGVQRAQVDTGVRGVPVDDCLIVDVFTQSEVCFEQVVVDLGEGVGLIAADPFGSG
jgi:hypothetical protein